MDAPNANQREWEKEPLRFWIMPFRLILFGHTFFWMLNSTWPDEIWPASLRDSILTPLFALWVGYAASIYTEDKVYAWLLRFPCFKTLNESRKFRIVTEGVRHLILLAALAFLVFLFIRFESMRYLFMNPLVLLWAGVIIGAFLIDKWQRRNAPRSL